MGTSLLLAFEGRIDFAASGFPSTTDSTAAGASAGRDFHEVEGKGGKIIGGRRVFPCIGRGGRAFPFC